MLVYTRIELDYIVKHAMMQCNEHDIVEHSRYSVCMYVCMYRHIYEKMKHTVCNV